MDKFFCPQPQSTTFIDIFFTYATVWITFFSQPVRFVDNQKIPLQQAVLFAIIIVFSLWSTMDNCVDKKTYPHLWIGCGYVFSHLVYNVVHSWWVLSKSRLFSLIYLFHKLIFLNK